MSNEPTSAPPQQRGPWTASTRPADARRQTIGPLRRHYFTLDILILYLFLLIFPWIVTCVLDVRPSLTKGSSYVGVGGQYTPTDLDAVGRWMQTIRTLNFINALIAIPVVSAVLGHAAVVHVQRQVAAGHKVDLHQFLSIANAAWASPNWPSYANGVTVSGGILILVSIAVPFFTSLLVWPLPIQVASCQDTYSAYAYYTSRERNECTNPSPKLTTIGYEPEPALLSAMPIDAFSPQLAARLSAVNENDLLDRAWAYSSRNKLLQFVTFQDLYAFTGFYNDILSMKPYFVSTQPTTVNTGVLREHSLRLNSSINCTHIDDNAFPTTCSGPRPLYRNSSVVRLCAPGAYNVSPWTMSKDRQDITEELFLGLGSPFTTIHCVANTTRGYFELPNMYNGGVPGDLLETWPTVDELASDFNDYTSEYNSYRGAGPYPRANESFQDVGLVDWPTSTHLPNDNHPVPGPLVATALTMFGNASWLFAANNVTAIISNATSSTNDNTIQEALAMSTLYQLCLTNPLPFASFLSHTADADENAYGGYCKYFLDHNYGDITFEKLLSIEMESWLSSFNDTNVATQLFGVGMYLASDTLLQHSIAAGATTHGANRDIRYSPGVTVVKPAMDSGSRIFVTLILGIEVFALVGLAGYIYWTPSLGRRFDAVAVMIVGAKLKDAIGESMPRLGMVDDAALARLDKIDTMPAFADAVGDSTGIELAEQGTAPTSGAVLQRRMSEATIVDETHDAQERVE